MKRVFGILIFALLAIASKADVTPATSWVHFEGAANNTVITPAVLTNGTTGSKFLGWETITDGSAQTDGATPDITISSQASMNLFTPPSINGTIFSGTGGTNGMRFQMTNDYCIQTTFPGNGYDLSVGFFLRFNGPNVNSQPRDVMSLRADPSGAYQFLQIYDGPTKHFHTHWQDTSFAGGSGNDVNIQSNTWYWVTAKHVSAGQKFFISFYDPTNNYALIGTSSNTVAASTAVKCTTFQIGMIHYGSSGGDVNQRLQSMDIDNILIDTNGVFPLGPGGGPLIAATNRIDWTLAGIPGGIPSVTTIFTNFAAGATYAQVQGAINACPSNQVVKLGAGLFDFTASGSLDMKSGVVLRGAGSNDTIIATATGSTAVGGITLGSEWLSGNARTVPMFSGYTQGSSNIVLSASDVPLHAGFIGTIDQTNDLTFVYNGVNIPGGFLRTDITPEADGLRCLNQTLKIVSITNGTNLVVWPPLYWTYSANRSPQLYYRPSTSSTINYITKSGIEDLCVSNSFADGNPIALNRAAYCWVKNCKTVNAAVYHIVLYRSYGCNIQGNWCNGSLDTTASHGYGIDCEYQSCANVIENNIISNNRDFVKASSGSAGNVVIFNYHTNALANPDAPNFTVHSGGSHSAHPMMNLFEGNITYKLVYDFYWGSSSHQTLARNWLKALMPYSSQSGAALVIDTTNTYYQVVGNILGYPNITTNTGLYSTFSRLKISPATMDYDANYSSIRAGYYQDNDTGGGNNSTNLWNTFTVNGNYDYVAGSLVNYNPSTNQFIPDSYYYSAAPSYWGSAPWPPFNPSTGTVAETNIPAGLRFAQSLTDTTPPNFVSATIQNSGTQIAITFNEPVLIGANGSSGWALTMSGGSALTLTYSSGAGTVTLLYNISRTLLNSETKVAGLSYTQPTNGLEDSSGNDLATFSNAAVVNGSGQTGITSPYTLSVFGQSQIRGQARSK